MKDTVTASLTLAAALRPSYCQRWHACPEMAGTEEHGAHAARVARILCFVWPEASADALIWALTHDDGEMGLGDVSGPAKRENPTLALLLDKAEATNRRALGIGPIALPASVEVLCDLCDKVAGLYHVRQVRPWLLDTPPFRADLEEMARRFATIAARQSQPIQVLRLCFEEDFAQWLTE